MSSAFQLSYELGGFCRDISNAFLDAKDAYARGEIQPATFHSVTELTALRLHSRVETFFEELFITCMLGTSGIEVDRLIEANSTSQAYSLLSREQGRESDYLTWLPLERTLERARNVFVVGRPFSRLAYRTVVITGLRELVIVRNVIAHPGQLAKRKFVEMASTMGYRVDRSAEFLLSQRDGRSEVEHLIALARAVGAGLAEPAEVDVETILGSERAFSSDEKWVPPGGYACLACEVVAAIGPRGGSLPLCPCTAAPDGPCPVCGQLSPCSTCSKPRAPQSKYSRTICS